MPSNNSGFEYILQCERERISKSEVLRVLDIGAGGFCGDTTTKYLSLYNSELTLIEKNEELISSLVSRFPEANVIVGDIFQNLHLIENCDLLICDLPLAMIAEQWNLQKSSILSTIIRGRKLAILSVVYDPEKLYVEESGSTSIIHSHKAINEINRIFGVNVVTEETINQYLLNHKFRCLRLVDKFMNDSRIKGIGWAFIAPI